MLLKTQCPGKLSYFTLKKKKKQKNQQETAGAGERE